MTFGSRRNTKRISNIQRRSDFYPHTIMEHGVLLRIKQRNAAKNK